MWQRIQTLYLAVATGLVASMFFCDKAEDIRYLAYYPYAIFLVVITLLDLLALTTFRFRVFQFRTAGLAAIVTLAFQLWIGLDFFLTHNDVLFKLSAVFPLVAVILDILAARSIWADELIVRSASRLRSAKKK